MRVEILEFTLERLTNQIKPTVSDKRQFETNCRNEFMCDIIGHNMNNINKHKSYIGKKVHKFMKSLSYTDLESYTNNKEINKSLNPIEEEPIEFTKEMYDVFLEYLIQYQIVYQTEYLIGHSITCNSTHKLTNIEFEWKK